MMLFISPPKFVAQLSPKLRWGERVLTSSPGFSRCLVTGFFAHSIWLSLVLCHSGVDAPSNKSVLSSLDHWVAILDDVGADGRLEHRRERVSLSTGLALCRSNRDSRTRRHLSGDCLWCFVVINVDDVRH